jgi:hypothetical protein
MLRSIFRVWSPAVAALALTLACSSSGARSEVVTVAGGSMSSSGIDNTGASARSASSAPVEIAPRSDSRALGSGSIQAIEQVVTTQALLVSLLLAPFWKDRPEQPVARVDPARVDAARDRARPSAR